MTVLKKTLAAVAATGLIAAQPALAAAPDRSATPLAESEDLAGMGSGLLIALAGIAAAILFVVIDESNDDDFPASP